MYLYHLIFYLVRTYFGKTLISSNSMYSVNLHTVPMSGTLASPCAFCIVKEGSCCLSLQGKVHLPFLLL